MYIRQFEGVGNKSSENYLVVALQCKLTVIIDKELTIPMAVTEW